MKKLLSICLAAVLVLSMVACGGAPAAASPAPAAPAASGGAAGTGVPAPPSSPKKFSMASGSVGGNFYLMGG
ncbi:MAG: hypothetical protein RR049_06845, partial [Angelakisella sp.]